MENILYQLKIEEIKPVDFETVLKKLKSEGIIINHMVFDLVKFVEILSQFKIDSNLFAKYCKLEFF